LGERQHGAEVVGKLGSEDEGAGRVDGEHAVTVCRVPSCDECAQPLERVAIVHPGAISDLRCRARSQHQGVHQAHTVSER